MSEFPQVSVIIVARNAADTVDLAIASLISQSCQDWECIVVDDASSDRTPTILSHLSDERFNIATLSERLGRGGARNKALELVRGKYLATLDADDFLYPDALAHLSESLDSDPSLGACTGSLMLMSQSCRPFGRRRTQLPPGEFYLQSPLTTRLPLGSTMIRTSLIRQNRFDCSYRRTEDRDFFDRVLRNQRVRVLEEQTYAYRWSLKLESVLEGLRNREVLFRRHLAERPAQVVGQLLLTRLKLLLYPWLGRLGFWGFLNRRRAVSPTPKECERFQRALELVARCAQEKDFPLA